MDNDTEKAFDFEYWAQLWKRDPQVFEVERARLMKMFIASAPESKRQRLHAIQWRVDIVRKQAKTPMAASLRVQKMMWDSLCGKHGLLNALEMLKGSRVSEPEAQQSADILPFDRSKAHAGET
jgi:hypothetical protein